MAYDMRFYGVETESGYAGCGFSSFALTENMYPVEKRLRSFFPTSSITGFTSDPQKLNISRFLWRSKLVLDVEYSLEFGKCKHNVWVNLSFFSFNAFIIFSGCHFRFSLFLVRKFYFGDLKKPQAFHQKLNFQNIT